MKEYTLIDTAGQLTAVIDEPINIADQAIIGQKLLSQYPTMGQVAFVNPSIRMMGGELSINGTIAAQYYLNKYRKPVLMTVKFEKSIVTQILNDEVIFSGIKYKLINTNVYKNTARQYCGTDVACGFIIEKNPGEIIPIVYVKSTDTLITETACGSASLAYYLLTGISRVVQPSSQTISIEETYDNYQISLIAKVVRKNRATESVKECGCFKM